RSFFFSSRRRHTRFSRDWSSDVCSSDLAVRWLLDQGATTALWGARHPGQLKPIDEVFGWSLDAAAKAEIDHILREEITVPVGPRSEEHTSELQSRENLVCRLLLEKKKKK